MIFLRRVNVMTFAMCLSLLAGVTQADDLTLSRIIASDHRLETNKARDQYRHPLQTLEFMGIQAEMTVIEVWPGKGWYTELLAPFLKQGGGKFIAAGFPQHAGPKWRQTMLRNYIQWMAKSPAYYDQADIIELGPPNYWKLGTKNSVDAVLSFRNVHNWLKGGYENNMFSAFYRVIKPGGVLGITDHRTYPDTDIETMKQSGYLSERLVISLATQAGFVLEATSEINANKKDIKTHIKGVWTLPPTLRLGEKDRAKYLAIGESDRMTLRFRKPK